MSFRFPVEVAHIASIDCVAEPQIKSLISICPPVCILTFFLNREFVLSSLSSVSVAASAPLRWAISSSSFATWDLLYLWCKYVRDSGASEAILLCLRHQRRIESCRTENTEREKHENPGSKSFFRLSQMIAFHLLNYFLGWPTGKLVAINCRDDCKIVLYLQKKH